jgi:hypothetical protein
MITNNPANLSVRGASTETTRFYMGSLMSCLVKSSSHHKRETASASLSIGLNLDMNRRRISTSTKMRRSTSLRASLRCTAWSGHLHGTASGSNDICASRSGPRSRYRREIWNKNSYTYRNRRVASTLPGVWGATSPPESLMKDFLGRAPVPFAPEKLSGRSSLALILCGAWQIPSKIL